MSKYTVEGKEIDLIDDTDWDLCILIDSCRYNVFKEIYENILKGISNDIPLKSACSHCEGTKEFLKTHLNRDVIDIIYINHTVSTDYWIPNTKFFKLVNVWKTHWDYKKWGTIMPWDMADVAIEYLHKYPKKRLMLHFVQAHPPYLLKGYEEFNKIEWTPERSLARLASGKKRGSSSNWRMFYQGKMRKHLGYERAWKWLIRFGIEPSDYYGRIYKKFGMDGLVYGYRDNMALTLKEVKRVIEASDRKKILISADHSQSLTGDRKGMRQELIPWLEIQK